MDKNRLQRLAGIDEIVVKPAQRPIEVLGDLIDEMQDDEQGLDQGLSPSELIDYDEVAEEAARLGLKVNIKKLMQLAKANDTGFLYSGKEMVERALKINEIVVKPTSPAHYDFEIGDKVVYQYEGDEKEFGKVINRAKDYYEAVMMGGSGFDVWENFFNDEEYAEEMGYDSLEEWEKEVIAPLKNGVWYEIQNEYELNPFEQDNRWFPAEYVESSKGYRN